MPDRKSSFGTCAFQRTSPPRNTLSPATPVLNVTVSFEEALKLSLAIDECVRELNKLKRSTKKAKITGVNLAVMLDMRRITVTKGRL